jgi:hypothetical protein
LKGNNEMKKSVGVPVVVISVLALIGVVVLIYNSVGGKTETAGYSKPPAAGGREFGAQYGAQMGQQMQQTGGRGAGGGPGGPPPGYMNRGPGGMPGSGPGGMPGGR